MNSPTGLLTITALVLFWFLPVSAWFVIRERSDSATRLWFGAAFFGALGTTLFTFNGQNPSSIPAVFTNLLISCQILIMGESLRREFGQRPPALAMPAAVLGCQILMNAALILSHHSAWIPPANVAVVSALNVWLLVRLLRVIDLKNSRSLWVVAIPLLAVVLANLWRYLEFAQSGAWPFFFQFTAASNAALLAQLISVVFYSFGYSGFVIEKQHAAVLTSQRETREARQDEEVAEAKSRMYANLLVERDTLIHKLASMQKLAQAGALSASIAHELNQPLAAARIDAQEALCSLDLPQGGERVRHLLQRVLQHNDHAAQVIRTIRGVFSQQTLAFEKRTLDDVVRAVLTFVESQARELKITVRTDLKAPENIQLGSGELEHVLLNLCMNAIDALQDQPLRELRIRTHLTPGLAHLCVEDTGPGIAPAQHSVLFALLKTDKADGMGLGMWLSSFILGKNGGKISLDESFTQGSRFLVTMPVAVAASPLPVAPRALQAGMRP